MYVCIMYVLMCLSTYVCNDVYMYDAYMYVFIGLTRTKCFTPAWPSSGHKLFYN
jgi:hypothetical protein